MRDKLNQLFKPEQSRSSNNSSDSIGKGKKSIIKIWKIAKTTNGKFEKWNATNRKEGQNYADKTMKYVTRMVEKTNDVSATIIIFNRKFTFFE